MPEDALIPLSTETITQALKEREVGSFGAPVRYFAQVGSTNDIAKQLADNSGPEGTLVITDEQTQGRGRMGRRWAAPPNTSLLMSLIFRPNLPVDEANRLVMVVGLAATDAIQSLTALPVEIKWPNDLVVSGAKVAGILAESKSTSQRLDYVIVGLGINVNWQADPLDDLRYPATSLRREIGRSVDRLALLVDYLERVNHWYQLLDDPALDRVWQARMVTLGQQVSVTLPSGTVHGIAEQIDRSGALWVRTEDNEIVRLAAGDVTLRETG